MATHHGLKSTLAVLTLSAGAAFADPPVPAAAGPAPTAVPTPAAPSSPAPGSLLLPLRLLGGPTPRVVPSLRLEAARVAADRFAEDWRYPEPGTVLGLQGGDWFLGAGQYRPRSRRAAALHGGSMAATLVGEILLSANSPLAGVGAMLAGATLDAAVADADRDAEARR